MSPTGPRVQVHPPDPAWAARFAMLRDRVAPALRGIATAIEHVGSTSVPGLPAKDVVDMDVVVADPADVPRAIQALATCGYGHRGDLGIPGRQAFRAPPHLPRHNLYVCVEGAVALRNHRLLRDHLRSHAADRAAYGALKRALAARHPDDIDRYTAGKTAFILGVLARCGADPAALREIEGANRVDGSRGRDAQ